MSEGSIGFLTFGRDDLAHGLKMCIDGLPKNWEVHRVTPKTAHLVDVLLFSVFWWEHVYLVADFLRKSGLLKRKDRPRIYIGGFNSFNPAPMIPYCDGVFVGDGEESLGEVIAGHDTPGLWTGQGTVKLHQVSSLRPFSIVTNEIQRIEIARGCPHKCRFCAVSHIKKYRELPAADIEELIKGSKIKRVSLFSPTPLEHSQRHEIEMIVKRQRVVRMDSDARIEQMHMIKGNRPRTGLDGMSERLRRMINKPRTNESIIRHTCRAARLGVRFFFIYIILDLPGEQKEDWEELREVFERLGERKEMQDVTLRPSPSVFMPTPHTPMENDPINWERDYNSIWTEYFGRGVQNRNWKLKMAEVRRIFTSGNRVLSMIATRAGEEFFEIEKELTEKKVIAVRRAAGVDRVKCIDEKGLVKALEKWGGVEAYTGSPKNKPWKVVDVG